MLGGTGDWAGRGGSRMITGLAARRGALTPWAGKEAGAWMGSQRVGCWSSLTLCAGRTWEAGAGDWERVEGPGRKEDILRPLRGQRGAGGWALISESHTMIPESWSHGTAECRSWIKPDASWHLASLAQMPALLSSPSALGTVLSTLPFNLYNNPGRWVGLSSFL